MSITARDRKILMALVPIALAIAFYFFLLAPKREEARLAGDRLVEQQQRRDEAVAKLELASRTQADFAADYAEMVKLGKAIPSSVDTPSLLIQLDRAARGTEIDFRSVKAGEQGGSPGGGGSPAPSPGGASSSGGGSPSGGSSGSGGTPSSGEGSSGGTSGGSGSPSAAPSSGGSDSPAAAPSSAGSSAPGLENVSLDFEFVGSYFDLASFFHRMKRFVYIEDDRIQVRGRLMTIDSVNLSREEDSSGLLAKIKATVYLSPSSQGATGGATAQGPAAQPAASPASSSETEASSSETPR